MTDTINLADPKLYKIVNENKENEPKKEKNNVPHTTMVVVENKCMNPLMKFLTILFVLKVYIFIFNELLINKSI